MHGLGGMSGGGIFGDAAVATSIYDPAAMQRAESRAGPAIQLRTLRLLERLEERVLGSGARAGALEAPERRKRLPR